MHVGGIGGGIGSGRINANGAANSVLRVIAGLVSWGYAGVALAIDGIASGWS
jgi:hypothetical protein